MIRFYIGLVESVDEVSHKIMFTLPDLTGSSGFSIPAIPLNPSTTIPEVDDEVLILRPESGVELFYYTLMPDPESSDMLVQLKYHDATVKVSRDSDSEDSPYTIVIDTNSNSSVTLSKDSIEAKTEKVTATMSSENVSISITNGSKMTMSSESVLINDHLKVLL